MQYASSIPVLLLALLAALTRGDDSQPQPSSQSAAEHHVQVRLAPLRTFDDDEDGALLGTFSKRGWQDLQSSGWGKRGWQDLQSSGWGKRGWQDLQSSGWGKRGWQDLQSSGWGKRGWKDMPSQGWGKRGWKDLNSSWGKRGWQDLQGPWGKRDNSLDYFEDDDYSGEAADKRAWQNLKGNWGKRSVNWDGLVSRGKRDPNWQSLKGLWGKRSLDSMSDNLENRNIFESFSKCFPFGCPNSRGKGSDKVHEEKDFTFSQPSSGTSEESELEQLGRRQERDHFYSNQNHFQNIDVNTDELKNRNIFESFSKCFPFGCPNAQGKSPDEDHVEKDFTFSQPSSGKSEESNLEQLGRQKRGLFYSNENHFQNIDVETDELKNRNIFESFSKCFPFGCPNAEVKSPDGVHEEKDFTFSQPPSSGSEQTSAS